MYSGEYDACAMLLWVYIHTGARGLKNIIIIIIII
jgi:hypothetical protein